MDRLDNFEALFEGSGRSWKSFFDKMREIEKNVEDSSELDPFTLL
jgi:hypothetical protein